jgi:NadR type nicotinamide-nucleotide adenylyltransferase
VPAERPLIVALTGPESTGKTWLTGLLAERFDAPYSAESARAYVDALLARDPHVMLSYDTVDPIARGQVALEDAAEREARRRGRPLALRDTDLVSTVAYSRLLYGAAPEWVERAARARRASLYLLCEVDVPFVDDPVRRDAPEDRHAAQDAFVATLTEMRCTWTAIGGDWADRAVAAERAVERLLGGSTIRAGGSGP